MAQRKRNQVQPHADYGLFAPDSVTRKVWGYPTTPLHGIVRAVTVEELDPNLIAAVDATRANYDRLPTRYARTVQYFAAVAFADSATAVKMADVLVKIHSKAIGTEPVGGGHYDANDPDSQLWILVTGWHSVLKAYETFGPGRLTEDEVNQYWAECAIAAELQTCDPAAVPRSRAEAEAYFDSWRPRMAASEAAQRMMWHLLNGVDAVVVSGPLRLIRRPANWMIRTGTIALLPRYVRRLAGIRQSRVTDVLVTIMLRAFFATFRGAKAPQRYVLRALAPNTVAIVEPHWRGIPPVDPRVVTPAEARAELGLARPAEAHLDLRAQQRRRVFDLGEAPSESGIVESQGLLGGTGRIVSHR